MKEKNDYGMYSGGYLFDMMDRAALFYIRHQANLSDKEVLVTKRADNVVFMRQVCDKYNVTARCSRYYETRLYSTIYTCYTEVLDNKGNICACATFSFTLATNHCEIKEGKDEQNNS